MVGMQARTREALFWQAMNNNLQPDYLQPGGKSSHAASCAGLPIPDYVV